MTVPRCISDISSAVPLVSHMKHKPWKVCLTSIQHSRYSVQFFINIPKHHGNNFILYVKKYLGNFSVHPGWIVGGEYQATIRIGVFLMVQYFGLIVGQQPNRFLQIDPASGS